MAKYRFEEIAINSTEKKKPVEEDRFTYLGLEHLDSGSLKVTRFGAEVAPIGEKLVMRKGDVLFGKRRAYQKKVAIAPFDGIFSAHGMVLRPKEDVVDKDFFPLFISSDYFLDAAIEISVGSLSPTINWRDLKNLEFELPDLETQHKLAEVLWSINDTMEAYKKLIAATDELVKSQFMEQFGEKDYPLQRVGEMSDVITKGTTPTTIGFNFVKEGVNFIKVENITATGQIMLSDLMHITSECHEKLSRSQLMDGDILFSIAGAIGRIAVVPADILPANTNQALAIIRLKKSTSILKSYLLSALASPFVEKQYNLQKKGIAQINLTLKNIADLVIPVPPIEQQEQFATFVRQSDKSKFAALRCSNLNLWSSSLPI
ncbi:MAG: restriction endonuclease subunit S [Clostridiales bacterium]|nr:restriction endonuclease subunit S [Clostridiales bacterium]